MGLPVVVACIFRIGPVVDAVEKFRSLVANPSYISTALAVVVAIVNAALGSVVPMPNCFPAES